MDNWATKAAIIVAIAVTVFVGHKIYTVEKDSCLSQLAWHMRKCQPYSCLLSKHPYTQAEDKASIAGFDKGGRCLYTVESTQSSIQCAFPKNVLGIVSAELYQKDRAERYGPVEKSKVGWRKNSKTGQQEKVAQILIKGRWEEFHHTMQDALDVGICVAQNKKEK